MEPNTTISGLTRGSILRPLLKEHGKSGFSVKKLWNRLCQDKNVDYDPNNCKKLCVLRRNIAHKWKKFPSYKRFSANYETWLDEEFEITELPECLHYKKIGEENNISLPNDTLEPQNLDSPNENEKMQNY